MSDRPIEPSNYDLAGIPDSVYTWAKWLEADHATLTARAEAAEAELAALKASLPDVRRKAYDAGFAASAQGYNAEHPGDYKTDEYWLAQRAAAIRAMEDGE